MGPNRPKGSLRNALDRDVYQIVKKLEDERSQNPPKNGKKRSKLSIDEVYEVIKKSNSSLSRQKRKPLEDAIERVLDFHRQEISDSEDSEAALEEAESKMNKPEDRFLLNRQLTKHWSTPTAAVNNDSKDGASVSTAQGPDSHSKSTKRKRLASPDTDATAVSGARTPKTNGVSNTDSQQAATRKTPKPSKYGPEHTPSNAVVLGGVRSTLEELNRDIFTMIQQPDDYPRFGDQPVGFLVSGPPGSGKQSLVRALATISSTPVVPLGKYLKETRSPEKVGKIITDVFDEARRCAPSVILVERLHDFMGGSKGSGSHSDFEQEVVSQLELGMRRLREWEQEQDSKAIAVVATTSKLEMIDPTLRRPDLFAQTINVKVPDTEAREEIFRVLTRDAGLGPDFDYKSLAVRTHGYVGDDIRAVVQMANRRARHRLIELEDARARRALLPPTPPVPEDHSLEQTLTTTATPAVTEAALQAQDSRAPSWVRDAANLGIWYDYISHHTYSAPPEVHLTLQDFTAAIAEHTPYMRREGFSTIPATSWSEVGALHSVRAAFQVSIVRRIKEPMLFAKFGKQRPAGVLLFGPPGCGKTLVAKAVANDAQASFILIKGPELLNKYVGESERAIRELFTRAKSCAPCILFFDEMDSLVPKRENTSTEAGARVVNALLAELDGAGDRGEVYVIGTSNRPDMIDPAVLRPGRLDKLLFVDLPTEDERVDILKTIYRNGIGGGSRQQVEEAAGEDGDAQMTDEAHAQVEEGDIEAVARDERCSGFSGADLYGLYKNALDECVLRYEGGEPSLSKADWEAALNKTKPSVRNPETYRKLAAKLHHQG